MGRKKTVPLSGSGAITTALRSVRIAKDKVKGQRWDILHRVESELARAVGKRQRRSNPKHSKGGKKK